MDLQKEIMARSEAYLKSEKFSDALQKQVEDTIHEAVKSMFSYGELRDVIRQGLKDKIAVDITQIDFCHINQVVTDLVKKKCHQAFNDPLLAKLSKELDDMFQPAPKEITLQQFVDMWKEDLKEDCGCDGVENILVEIERSEYSSDGAGYLKIWNGGKKTEKSYLSSSSREIDPDLYIFIRGSGEISTIRDVNTGRGARNSLATSLYGKEAKVFMMYCSGTVFKDWSNADADNLDTSLYQH